MGRRVLGGLLAACLVAAGAAGLSIVGHTGVDAARLSATPPADPSPSQAAAPRLHGAPSAGPFEIAAGREAWTNQAVALVAHPGTHAATVHLGAGYPLTWLAGPVLADGQDWDQVAWQSASRHGLGWLPASAVALTDPGVEATAGLDALDPELEAFAESLGEKMGVAVFDADGGIIYGHMENHQYLMASSVKVAIMCAFLSQIEKQGREPTGHERYLLDSMIRFSDNKTTQELWEQIGDQKAVRAFLLGAGIQGFDVASNHNGWGLSLASPLAVVALLRALHEGTILTPGHRALALRLMARVMPEHRIGVGDSSPAGAEVALKDGWYPARDGSGTWLMNSSGIVKVSGRTYILSVFTDGNRSLTDGKRIVRKVCYLVGVSMVASEAPDSRRLLTPQ